MKFVPITNQQSPINNQIGWRCRYFFVFRGKKLGGRRKLSLNIGKVKDKDSPPEPRSRLERAIEGFFATRKVKF